VTRLISMLFLNATSYWCWKRSLMFFVVQPPWTPLNAPTRTCPAGISRNSDA
jgi:hypothetical protein